LPALEYPRQKKNFERSEKLLLGWPLPIQILSWSNFERSIPDNELSSVIKFCHSKACGGHFSS
jgi:hypothetical protein